MFKQFKLAASLMLLSIPALAQNAQTPNGDFLNPLANRGNLLAPHVDGSLQDSTNAATRAAITRAGKDVFQFRIPQEAPILSPLRSPSVSFQMPSNKGGFKQQPYFPRSAEIAPPTPLKEVLWQMVRRRIPAHENSSKFSRIVRGVADHVEYRNVTKIYVWPNGAPANPAARETGKMNNAAFGSPDPMMPKPLVRLDDFVIK